MLIISPLYYIIYIYKYNVMALCGFCRFIWAGEKIRGQAGQRARFLYEWIWKRKEGDQRDLQSPKSADSLQVKKCKDLRCFLTVWNIDLQLGHIYGKCWDSYSIHGAYGDSMCKLGSPCYDIYTAQDRWKGDLTPDRTRWPARTSPATCTSWRITGP